jgi:uncharacterized protein (TIGR02646 family)
MTRIVKGPEPQELRNWREANAEIPQNLIYERGGWPTAAVKRQMLEEQGYLCAYTMQQIQAEDDCHIEHVVPQSQPNQPQFLDSDYNNLLACFPGNRLPAPADLNAPVWNPKYPYGAQKKAETQVSDNNFVSPLREDVERRFNYDPDGSIKAAPGDNAAESSIRILRLDHDQLVELRKAAVDYWVLDDMDLTIEGAEVLSATILEIDSKGRLPAFCLVVSQVASWYARRMREMN